MTDIENIEFGSSCVQGSRLGMGCWAVGGHGWGKIDDVDSIAAIKLAFDRGISFFDTADCYGLGKSETILKQSLGKHLTKVCVATKGGVRWNESGEVWNDSSPEYMQLAIENSLKRLGIERIPLYYHHKPDDRTPIPETMNMLMDMRKQGKIGEIGVANYSPFQLSEALTVAPIKAVQAKLNIFEQEHAHEFLNL